MSSILLNSGRHGTLAQESALQETGFTVQRQNKPREVTPKKSSYLKSTQKNVMFIEADTGVHYCLQIQKERN